MFEFALHEYIKSNLDLSNFNNTIAFGTGEGFTRPYVVMNKVSDLEERTTFCDNQGDNGKALLQFLAVAGGENTSADAAYVLKILNDLKSEVALIKGLIESVNYGDYRILQNRTQGVRVIQVQELNIWNAIFESTSTWEKV